MTLPFDIARCPGMTAAQCQTCRRREPGRDYWQAYISPAWAIQGCPNFIPPQAPITRAAASLAQQGVSE